MDSIKKQEDVINVVGLNNKYNKISTNSLNIEHESNRNIINIDSMNTINQIDPTIQKRTIFDTQLELIHYKRNNFAYINPFLNVPGPQLLFNKEIEIEKPVIPKKIVLSWSAISAFRNSESRTKKLFPFFQKSEIQKFTLENCNGIVQPGEMCALMGASGSGKTTLLNILNLISESNLKVSGEVMINGQIANTKIMSLVSCYIQQNDLFFGTLTVEEHLNFHVSYTICVSVSLNRVNQLHMSYYIEVLY
jgi:ABC-type multidrug transport system fused ATPase/permease subunit